MDYVYLYKGIPTEKGYVWQPGTQLIEPSETGWDNCHICDPDVREFKTTYKGETYNWTMTYLGVDRWDCNHNQIGLAISKNIEGPYIKFDRNPLVAYEDTTKWGVGQSTTIVKDSTTIQLFYHSTTENGPFCMREIKLNDLDNIILGAEKAIPFLSANSYPAMSDKNIYITRSANQLIEISYKDAGKRSGVQYLAGLLGIDRKDIAAVGDADNDIDMIQFAGYGVAMGNSTEHLKSIADYVTKSNDEDGVAYAIENILLN